MRTVMVTFSVGTHQNVEALVRASMQDLKPLELCEISCIRQTDGNIMVMLRSKKQQWIKRWKVVIRQCFKVDLDDTHVKANNMLCRTLLAFPSTSIVFQVRSRAIAADRALTPCASQMKAKEDELSLPPSLPSSQHQTPEKSMPVMPSAPSKKRVRFPQKLPTRHSLDFTPRKEPRTSEAPAGGAAVGEPKRSETAGAEASNAGPNAGPNAEPIAEPNAVPNAEPGAAPEPGAVSKAENPFARKRSQLKEYLDSPGYYFNHSFRAIETGEDLLTYLQEKRKTLNKMPKVFSTVLNLLPPVVKHSRFTKTPHLLVGLLSEAHQRSLSKLLKFFKAYDWQGCAALLPWNFLDEPKYHYPSSPEPFACHLECHRRVLRLEAAVASLAIYIGNVAQRSHTLLRVAQKALKDTHAVLAAGSGAYGGGAAFWHPPPATSGILSKLAPFAGAPDEEVQWLAAHREGAFASPFLIATELDWGLPLLGLVSAFSSLESEEGAAQALAACTAFREERLTVYRESLKPLALYGGRLTRYLGKVHALATAFKPLGADFKIDFPDNCKPYELEDGKILGLDKRPAALGHHSFKQSLPIPFAEDCAFLEPLPADQIASLKAKRYAAEAALVERLGDSQPVANMWRGFSQVQSILAEDSHLKNATHVLPPTASMLEAVFDTLQVFK